MELVRGDLRVVRENGVVWLIEGQERFRLDAEAARWALVAALPAVLAPSALPVASPEP